MCAPTFHNKVSCKLLGLTHLDLIYTHICMCVCGDAHYCTDEVVLFASVRYKGIREGLHYILWRSDDSRDSDQTQSSGS